jgi:hypothetical protein
MNRKHAYSILLIPILAFVLSCATKKGEDPLKNTKKLVVQGHSDLYHNGAFQVPNTSIYLIEPGPSAIDLIKEMAGLRARQAFFTALKKASESVVIVSKGTELSFKLAKAEREIGNDAAEYIRTHTRPGAVLIMDRSLANGKDIIGESFTLSREMIKYAFETKDKDGWFAKNGDRVAESMDRNGTESGKNLVSNSLTSSKEFYKDRTEGASESFRKAGKSFVTGYVALPKNLSSNLEAAGENLSKANLADVIRKAFGEREKMARPSVELMGSAKDNYSEDVKATFAKAQNELDQFRTTGIPLATLKSLRWILQGIFWDATIEPATKMTAGGLGYIAVNCVAFPVMIIQEEGVALTRIAVDVTWNASKSVYQITAPSAEASLAGIFGVLEYGSGPLVAGPMAAGGTVAGGTVVGASKVGGIVVKGSGRVAEATTRYIGVPLAAAGVAAGGSTLGVAVMGGGAVGSGSVFVSGETAAGGSELFGNIIAGTTAVTGTAVSAAGGTAYGVYQLSKAVAVPAGYEVGAGVVLSYETMAHLGAHTILAASDCAYLVLSLEGPRWVVYAVKDTLNMGDDLAPGTVVDLDEMRKSGEEIYNIPMSDSEMKAVVSETSKSLPRVMENEVSEMK